METEGVWEPEALPQRQRLRRVAADPERRGVGSPSPCTAVLMASRVMS